MVFPADSIPEAQLICECSSQRALQGAFFPELLLCADAPWKCPRGNPGTCNTGVNDLSNREAGSPSHAFEL